MPIVSRLILPLRILLVLVFAGFVVGQVMSVPGQFAHMAQEAPGLAVWRWPLTAFGMLELLCFHVVIVCIWKLLTRVREDRIFDERSFTWVSTIVWALGAAWVLLAVMSAAVITFLYVTPELRDPGLPILLIGMVLTGAVVVLLMAVMRALLRQATALRTNLDAVI